MDPFGADTGGGSLARRVRGGGQASRGASAAATSRLFELLAWRTRRRCASTSWCS
jgi:hypothetical protein